MNGVRFRALMEIVKQPYAWISCCLSDSVENLMATILHRLAPEEHPSPISRRGLTPKKFMRLLAGEGSR